MKNIIASRRKELGYTQQQLAEKLNVSDKVVSKWETGRSLPDTSILNDLARVLEITVNELLNSDVQNRESIQEVANTEAGLEYKNKFIITMAIQLIAVILLVVSRIAMERMQYRYGKGEMICYIVMVLAFLIEIVAITFYVVMRNKLLNKYPTSTQIDRKNINYLLICSYPLVVTVVAVFVACHGLLFHEQIIANLIIDTAFIIPFSLLFLWNRKRLN